MARRRAGGPEAVRGVPEQSGGPAPAASDLLARGEGVVPIPGTRSRQRAAENVAAAQVELTADDLTRIEAVAPPEAFTGTRYATAQMGSIGI